MWQYKSYFTVCCDATGNRWGCCWCRGWTTPGWLNCQMCSNYYIWLLKQIIFLPVFCGIYLFNEVQLSMLKRISLKEICDILFAFVIFSYIWSRFYQQQHALVHNKDIFVLICWAFHMHLMWLDSESPIWRFDTRGSWPITLWREARWPSEKEYWRGRWSSGTQKQRWRCVTRRAFWFTLIECYYKLLYSCPFKYQHNT